MINYQKSKKHINDLIDELILNIENEYLKNILTDVFKKGKRLRPILAYEINQKINEINKTNIQISKILLISEIIHSSSLIIDDLPCMDNDLFRRGDLAIHYKYGENRAQITTMYLLDLVIKFIMDDLDKLKKFNLDNYEERCIMVYECLNNNMGLFGAPFGQYLDICPSLEQCIQNSYFNHPKKFNLIEELINKKTSTFFEIAMVTSYIASGGDLNYVDDIKSCARSFGLAFQISDDFEDQEGDKGKDFCPNYVNHFGITSSRNKFLKEISNCKDILDKLKLNISTIGEIVKLLEGRVLKAKT